MLMIINVRVFALHFSFELKAVVFTSKHKWEKRKFPNCAHDLCKYCNLWTHSRNSIQMLFTLINVHLLFFCFLISPLLLLLLLIRTLSDLQLNSIYGCKDFLSSILFISGIFDLETTIMSFNTCTFPFVFSSLYLFRFSFLHFVVTNRNWNERLWHRMKSTQTIISILFIWNGQFQFA